MGDGEQPVSDAQRAILEEAKKNGTLTPELVDKVLGKDSGSARRAKYNLEEDARVEAKLAKRNKKE